MSDPHNHAGATGCSSTRVPAGRFFSQHRVTR